jgi:pimeloyl-ACP methyl ester carboxylesterase
LRIFGRLLIGLAGLALLIVGAGAAYQWIASWRDAARYPMPGKLVRLGERSLHMYCSGAGPVTVLLETGLTTTHSAWLLVQPMIAEFARVCSYDRAGMGWSDPSPDPTEAEYVAADLANALNAASIRAPLMLVGWSAGGVYIRRFYRDHPESVIAMVLVDSSHEQQRARLPRTPETEKMEEQLADRVELCSAVSWMGAVRATGVMSGVAERLKIPASIRPANVAMANRTSYCRGALREIRGFRADISSADPPAMLGDLPLVVLSRGRPSAASDFSGSVPSEYLTHFDATWAELQSELAALSTRSSHRSVASSGHAIPLEAPEAVVGAVRDLLAGSP